jgi:hypothetical protein
MGIARVHENIEKKNTKQIFVEESCSRKLIHQEVYISNNICQKRIFH